MRVLISFCIISVTSSNLTDLNRHSIKPNDVEDEIRGKLENLRFLVESSIAAALNELSSIAVETQHDHGYARVQAELAIDQEYKAVLDQIANIKNLAQESGTDIHACLIDNAAILEQLPIDIKDSLTDCLAFACREWIIIYNDSKYRLNIIMNEVNVFDFQIEVCAGDFSCLPPLVTELDVAMVTIPQKIGAELMKASQLHEKLKINVRQCNDDKVAQFNTEAELILSEITACVNDIIS